MIVRSVLLVLVASIAACGGGGGDSGGDAAVVLTTRLLGAEATDETRDDHDCVTEAVSDTFEGDTLEVLADAASLDDLDVPSRELLLQAALRCVSATQLAG